MDPKAAARKAAKAAATERDAKPVTKAKNQTSTCFGTESAASRCLQVHRNIDGEIHPTSLNRHNHAGRSICPRPKVPTSHPPICSSKATLRRRAEVPKRQKVQEVVARVKEAIAQYGLRRQGLGLAGNAPIKTIVVCGTQRG